MHKRKLLYFNWIITFLFWLYITVSITVVYYSLEPVQGTIARVEKSGTRLPVYTIYLKQYESRFTNPGNGTLSLLKPEPEANIEVLFYIRAQDVPKTSRNEVVPCFGLNHYRLADCYYFVVRPGLFHHLLIIFSSLIVCCLNALTYAVYKTKTAWRVFTASILVLFLLMLL